MEWVEVKGPTVEVAVEAALAELGIDSRDQVDIEVIQEPEKGFLGIGRTDAVVRVKPRPKKRRRKRPPSKKQAENKKRAESKKRTDQRAGQSGQQNKKPKQAADRPKSQQKPGTRQAKGGGESSAPPESREKTVSREEQAAVVGEFLEGLLDAFGLEGRVETRVDEDIIYADIEGSETEALVGARGAILQSIHELAKTVVQRKTQESARIRLDIAGYAERRREALRIYAERLGRQVLEEGGEVMLEAMNSAERKIIHDTVGEIDGVRTYSEGEEPRRSVVISAEEE